jgi:hypothetical protein
MTEPQWQTTCPDCGVADRLEVYVGKFSCNSEWDLGFLTL